MLESECKNINAPIFARRTPPRASDFLAHLAQVHSLVSPCQLVRLVDLGVAPVHNRALSLKQNTVAGALWQSAHCTMAPARTRTENPTRTLAAAPSTRAPDYRARHARDISGKDPQCAPLGHLSSPADALQPRALPPSCLAAWSTRVSTRAPRPRRGTGRSTPISGEDEPSAICRAFSLCGKFEGMTGTSLEL